MGNELRDKIYDMSNHFLPLDMFYNDIEHMAKYHSFNQESAFKDLEKIADFVLDLQSQLAEKEELRQQLEQLEKERELDNSFWKQECDSLQKTLAEKDKEIKQVTSKLQASYEKDQNQKAIEQLEKVKSAFGLINSKLDKVETIKEYIHYIDHQIKQLKEMK